MATPQQRFRALLIIVTALALWFGAMYLFFGTIRTRDLVLGPLVLATVWFALPRKGK